MWSVHLSAKPSKPCSFNPPTGIGRCKGKTIPDRLALTILVPCTFVLIRGGGDTPKESLGETGPFNHRVGNGVRVCSSGVLRRCVATALRKCSTCNSSQRTGGKLTTVHHELLGSFSLVRKRVPRPNPHFDATACSLFSACAAVLNCPRIRRSDPGILPCTCHVATVRSQQTDIATSFQ
jgi:hypothetical protein